MRSAVGFRTHCRDDETSPAAFPPAGRVDSRRQPAGVLSTFGCGRQPPSALHGGRAISNLWHTRRNVEGCGFVEVPRNQEFPGVLPETQATEFPVVLD